MSKIIKKRHNSDPLGFRNSVMEKEVLRIIAI